MRFMGLLGDGSGRRVSDEEKTPARTQIPIPGRFSGLAGVAAEADLSSLGVRAPRLVSDDGLGPFSLLRRFKPRHVASQWLTVPTS